MALDLVKRFFTAIFGSQDTPGSKKAVGLLIALVFLFICPILTRLGVEVTPEEKKWAMVLFIAWGGAQGLADFGKGAAKVDAEAVQLEAEPEDPPADVKSGTIDG